MSERWILQFCHCHYGPFLDVARQYAALFKGSSYKILTVYLTGEPSEAARLGSASDEVVFLNFTSNDVRGLKLSAIRAIKAIVSSRDLALVIAHRFKPIYIACLATRLPVIGVHHAFGDYKRMSRRWFVSAFRKRLSLLGVSNAVRDDIRQHLPAWTTDRIETLYNRLNVEAVTADLHSPMRARELLGLPADACIIGTVGRLHPDKDQATLISAFAKAIPDLPKNAVLAIAGGGPLDRELRRQAEVLGVSERVSFLGQIAQVRRFMPAFDVFVLSSDHEPFGMVILEAMAARVPVLATNCGGAPEVIARADQLFGLRDSDELARLLSTFLSPAESQFSEIRVDEAYRRLVTVFSDQAARERFFALPMTRKALASGEVG